MKPTPLISRIRQVLLVFALLVVLPAGFPAQPGLQQVAAAAPQAATTTATGCQWSYYPILDQALQPEQLLFNDPDQTPLTALSLGNLFQTSILQLASAGSADFNGDGKTDVFRTYLRGDGFLQWQYSSDGTAPWQDMAYASSALPVSQLQFGEFNGDNNTDVFASVYDYGINAYQWMYSPGGVNSFVNLKTSQLYPNRLALGDFNGDGVTDVFTATQNAGSYQWAYSPGGTGSTINLAHSAIDPALLRFGDFTGDGKTDVFAATQAADGSTQWLYSNGGADSYTDLITTTIPYSELQFGDFDGDGKTDVLVAESQSDGGLQIVYWPGGLSSGITLGHIPAPTPALRVGDFNGDGISDLMALRCGMYGPLAFTPIQTLAQSGYKTFYITLTGDINGDGLSDLILVSTCQNPNSFGTCASHHLQVGAALGTPSRTYTLVAPQQLGADALNFEYTKVLTGDFDGDGKTDLALINRDSNPMSIYIARSNGDGSFTMSSTQEFPGAWNDFNPVAGDFNGDGKTDLAFNTVCSFYTNSCSVGDNNSVYVATSSGAGVFTMGARQDLGPSGWTDFDAFAGDFNGDGKTDLVFNSTCQKTNYIDPTCTIGDANYVYTALSTGLGSFTLSALQTYGASGWSDYPVSIGLAGDLNGDRRTDLVWSSSYQAVANTNDNLVVAGFANLDGTFQLGSVQNFGSDWTGRLILADLNHDGKADLIWNNAPLGDTDVDTYAAATSNGNGTFNNLGAGSVYTGQGYFHLPDTNATGNLPTGLVIVSNRQDPISSALFVIAGNFPLSKLYLPTLMK